jgi:exodeoxyribonuclease VIII
MLDLETLSTGTNAVIWSIGACKFSVEPERYDHPILDTFHVTVDPADCQRMGLEIDARTVLWWMDSDRDAPRRELLDREYGWVDLAGALDAFRNWFGFGSLPVWGNGVGFDNVILKNAFERCNMETPWAFYHDRCYRTLKSLAPDVKINRTGTYHSAVDDAVSQAGHLIRILQYARSS